MYRRTTYSRDPRWLTVKFACKCAKCGAAIKRGDEAFYYPSTKDMYCQDDKCGGAASRDFESAAWDEAVYTGQW